MAGIPSPFVNSGIGLGSGDLVLAGTEFTFGPGAVLLRTYVSGNVVLRFPGSSADITIPASASEYIPIGPNVILRASTATDVHVFGV